MRGAGRAGICRYHNGGWSDAGRPMPLRVVYCWRESTKAMVGAAGPSQTAFTATVNAAATVLAICAPGLGMTLRRVKFDADENPASGY